MSCEGKENEPDPASDESENVEGTKATKGPIAKGSTRKKEGLKRKRAALATIEANTNQAKKVKTKTVKLAENDGVDGKWILVKVRGLLFFR